MSLSTSSIVAFASVVSFLSFAPSVTSAADFVALSPNANSGSQPYDPVFGEDFDVNPNQSIQVTKLGVFDNHSDGVLNTDSPTQPIVIQLWNRDTGVELARADFAGGAGNGTLTTVGSGQVFIKTLAAPVTLTAGATAGYYYISEDYSNAEQFINNSNFPTINDGGGLITFVGSGRASNGHNYMFNGSNGGFTDSGPANRYTGPNFVFQAAATPEPGSFAVIVLSGITLLRRSRSR